MERRTTCFAWVALVALVSTVLAVPDREACLKAFEGDEFAMDDDVIACVSRASDQCCEAIAAYMGLETPFANCTCSDDIVSRAISDSIPAFAVDLVMDRIAQCGTVPLSGSDACPSEPHARAFADDGDCKDAPPPYSDFTCVQQAGWGKCGEYFMRGYCDRSCGRCEEEAPKAAASSSAESTKDQFESGRSAALSEGGQ